MANCATGRFGGSYLGMSTVIPDRRAETFGVVELRIKEKIVFSSGHETENEVPVLVVVGKGTPVDRHVTRDLKAIHLKFQTRAEVVLDIDTHRISGIDESVLRQEGYYDLDFQQKGINQPLVDAADGGFETPVFQDWGPGSRSVLRLYEGLVQAGRPIGYDDDKCCRELIAMLIQEKGGFARWDLMPDLHRMMIGEIRENAIP